MRNLPFSIAIRQLNTSGAANSFGSWISRLAAFGLVITVSLLIVVLSVMNGFERELKKTILSIVPHVQIVDKNGISDWENQLSNIKEFSNVVEVTPFNEVNGLVLKASNSQPIKLLGLNESFMPVGLQKVFDKNDLSVPKAKEILISKKVAERLKLEELDYIKFVTPDSLFKPIEVYSLQIAGIFESGSEIDQYLAISSLENVGIIYGIGEKVFGFRLHILDEFKARETASEIIQTLNPNLGYKDWMQTHGNLYQAIQLSKTLVVLLMLMLVGIAIFNIVSMLMMSVLSRRKDIAVLQTLGFSQSQILKTFLLSGSMMGIFGIISGVLIGLLFCLMLPSVVSWIELILRSEVLDTSVYPLDYIPVHVNFGDILLVTSVSFGLCVIASVYPAFRASKILPSQELRYD